MFALLCYTQLNKEIGGYALYTIAKHGKMYSGYVVRNMAAIFCVELTVYRQEQEVARISSQYLVTTT